MPPPPQGERQQYYGNCSWSGRPVVISPDFPLELSRFFQGKHLTHFLVLKMKDLRDFVLDNCILYFHAEQVYLKPHVTNLKNKEVTANPKPQLANPRKQIVFRKSFTPYPKPLTLSTKIALNPKP